MSSESEVIIAQCKEQLAGFGSGGDINWLALIQQAMITVEKIRGLSGAEKKTLVLDSVTAAIESSSADETIKSRTLDILRVSGPPAIDMIVAAANGQIPINRKCLKKWFGWMGCCCK